MCSIAQLCLALCDSMDCSLPGSSVHGILQARILEYVSISFSRGSFWPALQVDSLPTELWRKLNYAGWRLIDIFSFNLLTSVTHLKLVLLFIYSLILFLHTQMWPCASLPRIKPCPTPSLFPAASSPLLCPHLPSKHWVLLTCFLLDLALNTGPFLTDFV